MYRSMFRALVTALLLSAAGPVGAACTKSVTFGAIDWPPYIIWEDHAQPYGLDIELIEEVFKRTGCKFEFSALPFKRALRDVESGRIDAAPSVSFLDERAGYGFYSLPVRGEIIGAFILKSMPAGDRPANLEAFLKSDLKVGAVLGGWYGPEFMEAYENDPAFRNRVTMAGDFETLFKWLEAGLIDVAVNDIAGGKYISDRMLTHAETALLDFPVHVNDVHLIFSRKTMSETDVEAINRAIADLRYSDTYRKILSRYLPADFEHFFTPTPASAAKR